MKAEFPSGSKSSSFVSFVYWTTGENLSLGLLALLAWLLTGDTAWVVIFFRYVGSLFFLLFTALEFSLSLFVWRQFSRGEPLGSAWFLISAAAACRLAGACLVHLLSVDSYLNPVHFSAHSWDESRALAWAKLGAAIGGPLHMAVLACGLLIVLQVYHRLGMLGRLRWSDFALLAFVMVYTLRQVYDLGEVLWAAREPLTLYGMINWTNDPLLCLLLFEAVLIRRSILAMGGGLIAKCWGAYTAAIFFTSLGDMGLWASSTGWIPWPLSSLAWYVWFLASAAYCLGPAFQVQATRRAKQELRNLNRITWAVN
jgi:hypothetical protein